jgi:hypothetical protein
MNKGIVKAKGEWLYFLGSDDYLMDSNVLQKFVDRVASEKVKFNLVYGNVKSAILGEEYDGEFDVHKILKKNICHQAIFYHKEVFSLVGFYNLKYKYLSDYEFNLRCFFHKKVKVKYLNLRIAYFTEGGLSNSRKDDAFYKDFPNRAIFIKKFAYQKLPIKEVKSCCGSHREFLLIMVKRIVRQISLG